MKGVRVSHLEQLEKKLEVRHEWMIIVEVECYSLFHPIMGSYFVLSSEFLYTNSGSITISIEFLFYYIIIMCYLPTTIVLFF